MDKYVHEAYTITKFFPKEEMYGSISQLRRSALSVVLNYIEGYSRRRKKVQLQFYEISYGSLGESEYLCYFALSENWINSEQYNKLIKMSDEIGKMLWSEITSVERSIEKGYK